MIARLVTLLEKYAAPAALFGGGALLLLGLLLSRGGMLHPEAQAFLPHYLDSSRAVARLVFDPAATDFGMYQARELSYFFDWLDCRFIAFCTFLGHPHFLSLAHVLFAAATAFLLWRLAAALALARAAGALLVLLYLSSPMILLGGDYFRSAKAGAAFCVMLSLWLYARLTRPGEDENRARPARLLGLGFAVFAAGLFDRQGVFLGLAACALHALRVLARPGRRNVILLGLLLTVAVLLQTYNRWLAPALIEKLNGYRPSFEFQSIVPASPAALPESLSILIFYGPTQIFRYLGALLGSLPWPLLAAAWLALAAVRLRARPRPWLSRPGLAALGLELWPFWLVLMLAAMTTLMTQRVSSILLPEFSLYYYSLPTAAVACGALAALATDLSARIRTTALLLIALLIAGNVALAPEHRRIQHRGYYAAAYDRSPALLDALRRANLQPAAERTALLRAGLPAATPVETTRALAAIVDRASPPGQP